MSKVCTGGKECREGELQRGRGTMKSMVWLKSVVPCLGRAKCGEVVDCKLGLSKRGELGTVDSPSLLWLARSS